MLNIFKYEFKMYQKSILLWMISIVGLLFAMMAFYPSFGNDSEILEKMLKNYPEELLKAFGMSGGIPLSSVLGYFVFTFVLVQLCLAIQAANYGFSILSVEEREFTADYLMSKPVSRVRIINAKFLAALLALTITNIVTWIGSFGCIEIFREGKEYDATKLIILLATILLFQLVFLTVGMAISVVLRRIRSVLTFSISLAFGTYILNSVRAIVGGETLGYLSPFYHFDPAYILKNGNLDISMVLISIVFIIVSVSVTYVFYLKRDIYSL
ncbi:MAG: ABC transporter permease subunit [Clostridiales bacterium]